MKKLLSIINLLLLVHLNMYAQEASPGEISPILPGAMTVIALDENGETLADEFATVYLPVIYQDVKNEKNNKSGLTNKEGKFYAKGEADFAGFGAEVGKLGEYGKIRREYYRSGCQVWLNRSLKNRRWEPWNSEIKLIVRKKMNPVPMYVKKVNPIIEKRIPRNKKLNFPAEIAYDLEKGDFCYPQGNGIVRDLIFNARMDERGRVNVVLKFSNEKDGIIRLDHEKIENCLVIDTPKKSYNYEFIGPREAPTEGYSTLLFDNLKVQENIFFPLMEDEEKSFYVFRVRSIVKESGEIQSACYGKIKGGFGFAVNDDGFVNISFLYYYNPTGTRNLEWDTAKNLFPSAEVGLGVPKAP